jgi:chromosome segregation protein
MAGGWMESLNALHAAVASAAEAARSAQNMRRERLAALADGRSQRDVRARQLGDLEAQHATAQANLQSAEQETATAASDLQELDALLHPIQVDLSVVERHLAGVEAKRREAERSLREVESQLNATLLELARHNDELEALYERAADSLELDDAQQLPIDGTDPSNVKRQTSEDAQPSLFAEPESPTVNQAQNPEPQTPIPNSEAAIENRKSKIKSLLESLPEVATLPEGMDERLTHLRNQIKRLGAINFEAQVEYEDLKQRHAFLTEQTTDLEHASASLQQVIVELNDVMQATFRQTFEAIATAFQSTFKILFGGGQARLTLTTPDNIDEAGIEIHAQPPGKRPQGLALLSGGERSLTATALLFAILRVKPTPFCVLDEVDAALDEANVGRFRNMLETLAEQTQFIVITHNRRTVEAANTVYGISMGADGASTALSLRLDEVEAAAATADNRA